MDQKTRQKTQSRFGIKQFLPRTLFGRSLVILVTPVALIQMIAAFMFFDRHWTKMTTRLAYAVAGEVTIVANAISHDPDPERVQRIIRYAKDHLSLQITFRPETELLQTQADYGSHIWKSLVAQKLRQELSAELQKPFVIDLDFQEKSATVYVQLEGGLLQVQLPQRRLFSSSGYVFLLWVFGTSIVLLIVAVIFMRNQIRPIRKLAAAAELFGKGRDAASFKPQGAREVRQAGEAFMNMRRRIKRQVEQRTAMLAGISHDLRTPLTRLKLQLSMMDETSDVLAMKDDIAVMENMIGGYLDFVRGDEDEAFSQVDAQELVQKLIGGSGHHALNISLRDMGDIQVTLKPLNFERALMNIVNNAAKHAKNLDIKVESDEAYVSFVFEDDGPGIAPEEYDDVFRPFFRLDDSRGIDESGGVGLGLSIAMDIVHAHGGQIKLDESVQSGLKVVIRIPH